MRIIMNLTRFQQKRHLNLITRHSLLRILPRLPRMINFRHWYSFLGWPSLLWSSSVFFSPQEYFGTFGEVTTVKLYYNAKGMSRRFAFVLYASADAFGRALSVRKRLGHHSKKAKSVPESLHDDHGDAGDPSFDRRLRNRGKWFKIVISMWESA